jgi:hypothetical protein
MMEENTPFVFSEEKESFQRKTSTGIMFKCNEKRWMMEELMVKWLREVCHRRRLGALLKKREMLVLDAFKGHLAKEVKTVASDLLNTDLVIIPGGMTSKLQVFDVVVNNPFSDWLHHLYGKWLLSGNCPLTPAGNIRSSEALLGMTHHQNPIIMGLKGCCVSNDMNGTDEEEEEDHGENSSSSNKSVDID